MFRLIRTDPGFRAEVDRLTCNNCTDEDPGRENHPNHDVTMIPNFFLRQLRYQSDNDNDNLRMSKFLLKIIFF